MRVAFVSDTRDTAGGVASGERAGDVHGVGEPRLSLSRFRSCRQGRWLRYNMVGRPGVWCVVDIFTAIPRGNRPIGFMMDHYAAD